MLMESLRESIKNLMRLPVQSSLATLGILFGMAGIILLASIGQGVTNSVNDQVNSIGPGLMSVVSSPVSDPTQNVVQLTIEDEQSIHPNDVENGLLSPVLQTTQLIAGGSTYENVPVVGVDVSFPEMRQMSFLEGRFFNIIEEEKRSHVVVLGKTIANRFFPNESALGKTILVGKGIYKVVGVSQFENGGQTGDVDNLLFMPTSVVLENFSNTDEISAILVKVVDTKQVPDVENRILNILQKDHRWKVPRTAFTVYKQTQILQSASQLSDLINMFVSGAILISFLLGGIGVMNVMLMAARDRQHEIGVFLAFGARPSFIQIQFLFEALWISMIGVTSGILVGTLIGLGLHANGYPWAFKWNVYVDSVLGGLLIGLVFGVYPSFLAARVQPADVIRKS